MLLKGDYYEFEELPSGISLTISGSDLAEKGQIWLGLFETIEKVQNIDNEIEQQKRELIPLEKHFSHAEQNTGS